MKYLESDQALGGHGALKKLMRDFVSVMSKESKADLIKSPLKKSNLKFKMRIFAVSFLWLLINEGK